MRARDESFKYDIVLVIVVLLLILTRIVKKCFNYILPILSIMYTDLSKIHSSLIFCLIKLFFIKSSLITYYGNYPQTKGTRNCWKKYLNMNCFIFIFQIVF